MRQYHSQQGFTLIEVLVAMLIVAIGLLSIVALQFQGLKYSHEAYLRSQISYLAYDIAETIRLNRDNAAGYVADYTVPTALPGGCTQATVGNVANDLACWRQRVYRALPPGSAANISQNGDNITVTLAWLDKNTNTTAPNTINYVFQPAPTPP